MEFDKRRQKMNIESTIRENIGRLRNEYTNLYVSPDIPAKKLDNAIAAYARDVQPGYVLALHDQTVFGSAKEGILFLGDRMYFSWNRRVISYLDIQDVELLKNFKLAKDGTKKEVEPSAIVTWSDGSKERFDEYLGSINKQGFKDFIRIIHDEVGTEETKLDSTNQLLPLSMMTDEVRETYIKFLCNAVYFDDAQIDSREYAEIMTLIAINSLNHESRMKIRTYMYDTDAMEDMDSLLEKLDSSVPSGSIEAVRLSLFKDAVNIRWDALNLDENRAAAREDRYIRELQDLLGIEDNKAEFIIEEIRNNKDILSERQNDDQIKKSLKETMAKAGAVGVPMAAVYLSGSVLGVSAAGITSGLATLGMGGILGFSSMFTGIGVAVLLGVGAYKGVRKVSGLDELEKNKEREMMLQEVAKNAQKTLNYLVEDINDLNDQLEKALSKQDVLDEKTRQLAVKLSSLMRQMGKGAQYTTGKMGYATKEQIICKLPRSINMDVVEKLAAGATHAEARDLLMKVYSRRETDEKQVINNCLDPDCSEEELAKAYSVLEAMGYFKLSDNAVASVRSAADSGVRDVKNFVKGLMN